MLYMQAGPIGSYHALLSNGGQAPVGVLGAGWRICTPGSHAFLSSEVLVLCPVDHAGLQGVYNSASPIHHNQTDAALATAGTFRRARMLDAAARTCCGRPGDLGGWLILAHREVGAQAENVLTTEVKCTIVLAQHLKARRVIEREPEERDPGAKAGGAVEFLRQRLWARGSTPSLRSTSPLRPVPRNRAALGTRGAPHLARINRKAAP
jgi:hypothetical protein